MNNKLLIITCLIFFSSCFSNSDEEVIASVDEKKLYLSDIKLNMPSNLEDSSYFVEKFINDWIRKEVMLAEAEMNLNSNLDKFEKQIEDYRASLLIHAYQQELLNQNFDTSISNLEVEEYFNQYKDDLILSNNIFKGRYIKIDKSVPEVENLKDLFHAEDLQNIENLKQYCIQFAAEFHLNDEKWIYFNLFNQKFPDFISDEVNFLKYNTSYKTEDEKYLYYLLIKDYQIKGSISPLSIVNNQIRNTILNTKKVNFLKNIEDELYQKALSKNKIKIY
tara:strand:- start:3148 stop:3978 length:831 start_codon:yes stop_codon:yes gene_type:complete